MSITYKTKEEIEKLREGGRILAGVLSELVKITVPGATAMDLENLANKILEEKGAKASFLNYKSEGSKEAYPASTCISINDGLVHGLPQSKLEPFKEGDIVSIDFGVIHEGLITDSAVTVGVGEIDEESRKLLNITKEATMRGIQAAKPGNHVGDIGFAIESEARKHGYGLAEGLAGHGVGYKVHEDPYIPNYGREGEGLELKEGMVIAIEPMFCLGSGKIKVDDDGFSISTKDGSRSAHFEHTVAITKNGPEILTKI